MRIMHFSDFLKNTVSKSEDKDITDLLITNDQSLIESIRELYAIEQFIEPMINSQFNIDNFSHVKINKIIIDMRGKLDVVDELRKIIDSLDINIHVIVISDVDSVRLEQRVQALGCCYVLWEPSLDNLLSVLKVQNHAHSSFNIRKAKRVLILGTKGGVGVTTISSALVHLMSNQGNLKTLLVDHDICAVNSDIYLGATNFKMKSSDIDIKEIDKTVSKTYVANISEKLGYMALEPSNTINEHFFTLYNISEKLKEEYSFIVDSVPHLYLNCLIKDKQIFEYDRIYIICEPSISSLRSYNYLKQKIGEFEHNIIFNMLKPSKDYVISLSSSKAKIKSSNTIDIIYESGFEKTIVQRGIDDILNLKFFTSVAHMVRQLSGKDLKTKSKFLSFIK